MPSSAEISAVLDAAAAGIVEQADSHTTPVVVIDGRSGSGKSTLASLVAPRLDAYVLALDSVYPGWDGLRAGVERVLHGVLLARASGYDGRWRAWDWNAGTPAEEHVVPSGRALIIEGAGSLTPETKALSDVQVWVESPEASRRSRALRRDGDTYRPHWDRWAAQEAAHIAAAAPEKLATFVVRVP